jgi:hypothetical protein
MFFWTVLMVTLFLIKSILNGVVWEVPWQMVTLMGISQAGYLAPKITASVQSSANPGQAAAGADGAVG